jgi:hypothetical protein
MHQEVSKEEATVETVGALGDQYGDRHLAVGCHQQSKKCTQGDDGSWKKLVAARRQTTHHAGMAWHKGHNHKGQTVEKR